MSGAYTHSKCGKRVRNSAYHCAGCHESFVGLSAFDAHRVGDGIKGSDTRLCVINVAEDAYAAKAKEFWLDESGYWHLGRRLTADEARAIFGGDS